LKRFVFPVFNALVVALLGALIGYYIGNLVNGILIGAFAGFTSALVAEFLFGIGGHERWLYKRRVLLLVLLEIPFFTFVVGPYAYVISELNPNPTQICCKTPLDFGAASYDDVSIDSEDGITLSGWYIPPQNDAGSVVILLHGAHGNRLGTSWFAQRLIEAGYGVMMYDQRALGESTGDTLSFGWLDWTDLLAVLDFVRKQENVDPNRIGVVGLSLGGHIALNMLNHDASVQAVWIDGLEAQGMVDFPVRQDIGEEFATFMNSLILKMIEFQLGRNAEPPFSEILPQIDTPLTLVAGGLNDFENRVNQQYRAVVTENTEIWIIPNAPHVGGFLVIPDEYTERMLAFFKTHLLEAD